MTAESNQTWDQFLAQYRDQTGDDFVVEGFDDVNHPTLWWVINFRDPDRLGAPADTPAPHHHPPGPPLALPLPRLPEGLLLVLRQRARPPV